jgi:KaiC/GvpD/RAD55 family RecA-like ATPase
MTEGKKLEKELADIADGSIILVEAGMEKAPEVILEAIKALTKKGASAIVVSANRPYKNLVSVYQKNGVDTKKVFIIDCVTKPNNAELEKAANVAYLDSVSDLTTISLAINNAMEALKGRKFVFFDSISTMLIYSKADVFAKFVHIIMTRMRIKNVGGVFISLEGETNKEVRAEIVQLCDKVIKV